LKVALLAGGFGTRLAEETQLRPKPMVEIGGHPILWHIMRIYEAADCNDFVIALGYKGEMIKDYFLNLRSYRHDIDIDMTTGSVQLHNAAPLPPWRVSLVDTGAGTETGGRLKRLGPWLADQDTFCLTYGDGVADIDVQKALEFHRLHGKLATVTIVRPPARFGSVTLEGDAITHFGEKLQAREGWINGGFFVLQREVLDYIDGDHIVWERQPMERLAAEGQLMAYRHNGFWQPMDTLREKSLLEHLWASGDAPWKVWK
jgi:glucose-1-phosphate cytidylyltransferase